MSQIVVQRSHQLAPKVVRRLAETVAERLQREYGGTFRCDGDRLMFSQAGASGHVAVAARTIEVQVDISFVLRPFRSHIEAEIRAYLDEHLTASAAPVSRPKGADPETPSASGGSPAPEPARRRGRRARI